MTTGAFKVLYAEDEEDDVLFMRRALKAACSTVELTVAKDGLDAIRALSQSDYRPDWGILDLKMPRCSGLEVLRWIRAHPTLKDLPISILSSSAEQSDMARVQALGIDDYIVKPVDYEGLMKVIRSLCARWGGPAHPRDGGAAEPGPRSGHP